MQSFANQKVIYFKKKRCQMMCSNLTCSIKFRIYSHPFLHINYFLTLYSLIPSFANRNVDKLVTFKCLLSSAYYSISFSKELQPFITRFYFQVQREKKGIIRWFLFHLSVSGPFCKFCEWLYLMPFTCCISLHIMHASNSLTREKQQPRQNHK